MYRVTEFRLRSLDRPGETITARRRDRSGEHRLPVLSEADLVARFAPRRPVCVPAPRKGRVTDPGYHKGRVPANKGLKYPPEPLTEDEILRLLEACPPTSPCRRRDHALIILLWRSGLRIHEALLLEPRDLDPTVGMVHVRRGKGGKAGYSAMDAWAFERVGEWLDFRSRYPRGPVFCICEGATKGVRAVGAPAFRVRLQELAIRASVSKRVHPHGFRHTLACDLMRSGNFPLSFIQHQLRHSNPATTANYLVGLGADHSLAAVAARPAPSFAAPARRVEVVDPVGLDVDRGLGRRAPMDAHDMFRANRQGPVSIPCDQEDDE